LFFTEYLFCFSIFIGKSSLGNIILGRKEFHARKAPKSVTTKCGVSDRILNDTRLVVVDTPGFFDTTLSPKVLIPEISGSYQVAAPGPHAFIIVLTFDRFTPQEEAVAKWVCEVFDERALDYCIIAFTGLDSLKGTPPLRKVGFSKKIGN
jgi:GTPase Era involved in 16S rRNA processing